MNSNKSNIFKTFEINNLKQIKTLLKIIEEDRNLAIKTTKVFSLSGTIYKYNRGVIGIGIDGDKKEIVLDGIDRNHSDATIEIGNLLDCPVDNPSINPFVNATSIVEKGTIIIQLEGDSIVVYLPEMISTEQYQQLITELNPRNNFKTITYYHMEQIYDDENITMDNLIAYCNSILAKKAMKRG